jgi:MFS transporter, ACS family, aldohexuronate transporter
MLSAVSVLAIAPLAPLLRDELGLSRAQVGLFLPAVYLGGVLMSLPAGWLTDRLGIRVTLTGGLALTGLMIGAAAQAPTLSLTLAGFFFAGLGFAVINPTTGKAIIERFPPRERGFAMGVKQTGLTLGGVTAALTVPAIGLSKGWRVALTAAAAASLAGAAAALVGVRSRASTAGPAVAHRPRLAEVAPFLARPSFLVLMASGFALSINQSSLLAYFALYARESQGLGVVAAGGLLALAQAGGTAGRVGWGIASDRVFGGRRRPGLILNAILGATMSLLFASGLPLTGPMAAGAAVLAGIGAFGWVGLYLALAAEVGGPRYAGLLTGLAVACAWSGVLVGPTLFGELLEVTGRYRWPWLGAAVTGLAAAIALGRIPPLVKR